MKRDSSQFLGNDNMVGTNSTTADKTFVVPKDGLSDGSVGLRNHNFVPLPLTKVRLADGIMVATTSTTRQ